MPWVIKEVGIHSVYMACFNSVSFTVEEDSGGRPFLIKGIQSAEDAVKAYEVGCEGIVVTNHAGRQVDGAVGSRTSFTSSSLVFLDPFVVEVLPEIVDAVGDSKR